MNYHIIIISLVIGLLFSHCDTFYSEKRPNNLISKSTMVDILCDIAIMDGIEGTMAVNPIFENAFNATYIYNKYNIDSVQLSQSERYYASNPRKYHRIHQQVIFRLEMIEDSLEMAEMKQRTQ
ncbi:MAG: DUF4296 domain-containing protein [Flavobacteriaceae bacterium]|nr:DUF4296 domain-containing protein [Flavobacteriaceae bacterium]MCY4215925.1 DUF4296 domain-containing protein [Flavobacteriaceae bacterium]MCY4253816.1 DUF4296 domain-containing protein [Flavobacteriaceae bacterium]